MASPQPGRQRGERRRRTCRILSLVLIPFSIGGIWQAIHGLLTQRQNYTFRAARRLDLTVRSCDVDVLPCPACSADVGRIRASVPILSYYRTVQYAMGTDYVDAVTFASTASCSGTLSRCRQRCLVQLFVPSLGGATHLEIKQATDDDATRIVVHVRPGAVAGTLRINGRAATTLVEQATVSSRLDIKSGLEPILVINSDIASGARLYAASNHVLVRTPASPPYASIVDYRSVSQFGCWSAMPPVQSASTAAPISYEDPWSQCSLGMDPWTYSAVQLRTRFDSASKLKVSSADLINGMEALGVCCGSGCPFRSRCTGDAYTYVPYGTSYARFADFVATVLAENATELVPYCHRRVAIGGSSGGASEPARSFRLTSDGGAVYYAHGGTPQRNMTAWSLTEGGASSQLRMLRSDAARLVAEVRPFAGGPDENAEDLVVVIDVVPSPGVPRARFVYTNQPVFLTLEPSLVNALTFGVLTPKVVRYRVHFASRGCDDETLPVDPSEYLQSASDGQYADAVYEDEAERLRQMGDQIYAAFLVWPRSHIWGQLALVGRSHQLTNADLWALTRDQESGEVQLVQYQQILYARVALWLSVAIGAFGAFAFVVLFEKVGAIVVRRRARQEELTRRLVQQMAAEKPQQRSDGAGDVEDGRRAKGEGVVADSQPPEDVMNEEDEEVLHELADDHDELVSADEQVSSADAPGALSPLSRPTILIDALIAPVIRELRDSFKHFVQLNCLVKLPPGQTPGSESLLGGLQHASAQVARSGVRQSASLLSRAMAWVTGARVHPAPQPVGTRYASMRAFRLRYESFCERHCASNPAAPLQPLPTLAAPSNPFFLGRF